MGADSPNRLTSHGSGLATTEVLTIGFGKNKTGVILRQYQSPVALGALGAANAIILDNIPLTEDFRLLRTELLISAISLTQGDVIYIGICDGELSVTEIAETLALGGSPIDRNDNLGKERAMRPIWLICQLTTEGGACAVPLEGALLVHNSKPWTFSAPEGFSIFAWNPLAVPLTAGAEVFFNATHFGVWVT